MDRESLIDDAVAGRGRAMDELLASCRAKVIRTCSRMLPCRQDAEDACQEALLAVATHLSSYSRDAPFDAWLNAVATNSARSTYRQLRRRAVESGHEFDLEQPDPRTTSVIAGTRLDLLEALDRLEQRHPTWVEAVVLRDLGDLTYETIAGHLGLPPGTVKSRVHDGRAQLRRMLAS